MKLLLPRVVLAVKGLRFLRSGDESEPNPSGEVPCLRGVGR